MPWRHDTSRRLVLALATLGAVVTVAGPGYTQANQDAVPRDSREHLKQARVALDEGAYAAAIAQADSVLAIDAVNADAFYYKGLAQVAVGDTAATVATLTRGVGVAPMSSRLKLFLARMYMAAGDLDGTDALVDAVLAIKPREGEALYLKGMVHWKRGELTEALELFDRSLEIGLAARGRP